MTLVIDESTRQVLQFECGCCQALADRTWAFVHDGVEHRAVYFASCTHHDGTPEAWLDVILGTWTDRDDDHLTFSCRVGPVADSPLPAATLVDGGYVAADQPVFGRKVSREEGLTHAALPDFWRVVDVVLEQDELVRRHLYGHPSSTVD